MSGSIEVDEVVAGYCLGLYKESLSIRRPGGFERFPETVDWDCGNGYDAIRLLPGWKGDELNLGVFWVVVCHGHG